MLERNSLLELKDFVQVYKLKDPLSKVKTVLFDMDGTLLNSEPSHLKAVRRTLIDQNVIYPEDKLKEKTIGKPDQEVFEMLSNEIPALKESSVAELCKKKIKYFVEQVDTDQNVEINPVIPELLDQLKAKNLRVGLVTASNKEETMALLKSTNILDYFDTIITADECYQSKPSPAPYLKAMRELKSHHSDCLIIEDSQTGLASAKATNAEVVKVSWYN